MSSAAPSVPSYSPGLQLLLRSPAGPQQLPKCPATPQVPSYSPMSPSTPRVSSCSPGPQLLYVLCLVAQSGPTLFDPRDCSLPGSSVHGDSPGKNTGMGCHALLQEIFPTQGSNLGLPHCRQIIHRLSHQGNSRILEWVAYPFSRGSSRPRN